MIIVSTAGGCRMCGMVDFNALSGKAGELLNEHGDKVEMAAEKVGDIVKDKFGHGDQVDAVVDKIKDLIPGGEVTEKPAG